MTVPKETLSLLLQLVEGENGTAQPRRVKSKLRSLERDGFVRWVQTPGCRSAGGGGWYLTQEGREAIAVVKEGR